MKRTLLSKSILRHSLFHLVILSITWVTIQLLALQQFGIVTNFEATKYIEQASHLLQTGSYTSENFLYYSTQILIIAFAQKIGAGYTLVVGLQLMLNALSTICFYKLIHKETGKLKVAFFFTFALLCMFYYQLYNVHLFTESLYFSFSILYFYYVFSIKRLTLLSIAGILAGLAILFFTRPVGIFFLPATFLFVVLKFYRKQAKIIFLTAGLLFVILFFFLLNRSLDSGGEFDFLLPYEEEQIICGISTIGGKNQLTIPVEKNSVQGLFYIATNHWKLFLTLSIRRLLAFFGMVRSYYSFGHNVFIGVYFYGLYLLCIAGIRRWTKTKAPALSFFLCLIFLTALTAALSCDEWHNRFIYAILPFIMLLASFAFLPPRNIAYNKTTKARPIDE